MNKSSSLSDFSIITPPACFSPADQSIYKVTAQYNQSGTDFQVSISPTLKSLINICGYPYNKEVRLRGLFIYKFDNIAGSYDSLNHLLSFGQDYLWRHAMAGELCPVEGDILLDLATGTGDSAKAIGRSGSMVVGLDVSIEMLMLARKKISGRRYHVLSGSAYAIPFRAETFTAVTCAFGIRNMPETAMALGEICRVMKKGGRLVILEFSMPGGFVRRPYYFYLRKMLPFIAGFFSNRGAYDYLGESIEKFYGPDEFARIILEAGFSRCEKRRLSLGCVYIHKAYKE